jgi:tRNA-binding protein
MGTDGRQTNSIVSFDDFKKIDLRVGRVVEVQDFSEGRYSTHVLKLDFGDEIGIKKSLARLSPNYQGEELVGQYVVAVVNFPPRQIGKHQSEVLVLGVPDANENVVLLRPDRSVPPGRSVF